MKTFAKVTGEDLAFFESILPGRVFSGGNVSSDYEHDEMTIYGLYAPEAVLLAQNTDEISAVLRYCCQKGIAVTPRGAGTGLCGGCVAVRGGIVLSTERMKRVLEVDEKNMTATVEPGVLLMEFPKALEGTGLFYPPDPGEKTATMGGNAMTNAGGMRAVRYGVTRDYVLGMEVVLSSGEILTLGGKNVKTSSGYSLIDLLVGSEGTLGILTKLTVKLIPEPKANISLLIPFDDLDTCIGAVPAVLGCGVGLLFGHSGHLRAGCAVYRPVSDPRCGHVLLGEPALLRLSGPEPDPDLHGLHLHWSLRCHHGSERGHHLGRV